MLVQVKGAGTNLVSLHAKIAPIFNSLYCSTDVYRTKGRLYRRQLWERDRDLPRHEGRTSPGLGLVSWSNARRTSTPQWAGSVVGSCRRVTGTCRGDRHE